MSLDEYRRSAVRNRARFDQMEARNADHLRSMSSETLYAVTKALCEAIDALESRSSLELDKPLAELSLRLALTVVAAALNDKMESEATL